MGSDTNNNSAFTWSHELGSHSYFAYLEVDHIDALYEEFTSKELEIRSKIEDKPWGQREFSIRTIDGHRITFGEEISRDVSKKNMASVK